MRLCDALSPTTVNGSLMDRVDAQRPEKLAETGEHFNLEYVDEK